MGRTRERSAARVGAGREAEFVAQRGEALRRPVDRELRARAVRALEAGKHVFVEKPSSHNVWERRKMVEAARRYGARHLGIGTDLCQGQPDSVVEWMRVGRWSKVIDYGEGSANAPGFPPMPDWFADNRDFGTIRDGLLATALSAEDVDGIMGGNWLRFYEESFEPNLPHDEIPEGAERSPLIQKHCQELTAADGYVVVALDERRVGAFRRLARGSRTMIPTCCSAAAGNSALIASWRNRLKMICSEVSFGWRMASRASSRVCTLAPK